MRTTHTHRIAMCGAGLAALLLLPSHGSAEPVLNSAASFVVVAGSTINNRGATTLGGSIGVSPGQAITGVPVGQPTSGMVYAGGDIAAQAQAELAAAYDLLEGMACNVRMTGVYLGDRTFTPGVNCFASAAHLKGNLNLDAQGDTAAVFVFQIGSALTVAPGVTVVLSNGAQERHVWWQVGSSANLGSASIMQGNVLAHSSINLHKGAVLMGRALARRGAVIMHANAIGPPGDTIVPTSRAGWGGLKVLYR